MDRIKKAIELKSELNRVSAFVEKMLQGEPIHLLDKDVALERLRFIYIGLNELNTENLSVNTETDVVLPEDDAEEKAPERGGSEGDYDPVEIPMKQEIAYADNSSGDEVNVVVEERAVTTMEELIEKPFMNQPIARDIIESLYGDSELCRKEKPFEPGRIPEQETEPTKEKEEEQQKERQTGRVLNETLGDGSVMKDVASVLSSQTASRLRQAIGLNDRLMLLSDLFDNNEEAYEGALTALDGCESIDDAYIYLYEHFTMDNNKDGVKLLITLLEAKFN